MLVRVLLLGLLLSGSAYAEHIVVSTPPSSGMLRLPLTLSSLPDAGTLKGINSDSPIYIEFFEAFQKPHVTGFKAFTNGIFKQVHQITTTIEVGDKKLTSFLLVDSIGSGVAIEFDEKGEPVLHKLDTAHKPDKSKGGFGVPIPVGRDVTITIHKSEVSGPGRQIIEHLLAALTRTAAGFVSMPVSAIGGDKATEELKAATEVAVSWLKNPTSKQLGRPLFFMRPSECEGSLAAICSGILVSQVLVLTDSDLPPKQFAQEHELVDGELRVRSTGKLYEDFAVFVHLKVSTYVPSYIFSEACRVALQQQPWGKRRELLKDCPVDSLAAMHRDQAERLLKAYDALRDGLDPESQALNVLDLYESYLAACGSRPSELPTNSYPCQRVKEVLDEKKQKDLLDQGTAIREFINHIKSPPAFSTREGPEYTCENAKTLSGHFKSGAEALLKKIPNCSLKSEDLRQPLHCGLRSVDELAKTYGAQQTQRLNNCVTHNLCSSSTAQARNTSLKGKPVLDMVVVGICDRGLGDNRRRSLLFDTSGLVSLYKDQRYREIQGRDPLSTDATWDVLKEVTLMSGLPEETQDWKDALNEARDGLERLRGEYDSVRRTANQFALGEYAAIEKLADSASKTLKDVGNRCPKLSEPVRELIRQFEQFADPLPQLYSGGKGYFAPVKSRDSAKELRVGRDKLYDALEREHGRLLRDCDPQPPPEPPTMCPSPSTSTVPTS